MKQIMSLVAAAALLVTSCETTRTSTSNNAAYDLPVSIRADFEAQYPTATNVTWMRYDATTTPMHPQSKLQQVKKLGMCFLRFISR